MRDDILSLLSRHLIAIRLYYESIDVVGNSSLQTYYCAGTAIILGEQLAVMIAGHAAAEIQKLQQNQNSTVKSCHLVDCFSDLAKSNLAIPISINENSTFSFDLGGLDFGFVNLPTNVARLMSGNGIVALDERQWRCDLPTKFQSVFMLGLPSELVLELKGNSPSVRLMPTLIPIDGYEIIPQDTDRGGFPRVHGTLRENFGLDSLKGMSGGPIFGFSNEYPDKYWVIATQGSWKKRTREIFASPLHEIGKLLDDWGVTKA